MNFRGSSVRMVPDHTLKMVAYALYLGPDTQGQAGELERRHHCHF